MTPENLPPKKTRATFALDSGVWEAVRDCVVALSGPPHRLTLTGFVGEAILREVRRRETECNGGKPFDKRTGGPRPGRPIAS